MNTNRIRTIVTIFAFLAITLGSGQVAFAQDQGQPVDNGTTLTAGQLAVWEVATWPSTSIYAGYVPDGGFAVSKDHNAWMPYNSVKDAISGACDTAYNRLNKDGFTSVQVNNQPFDASSCKNLTAFGTAPANAATPTPDGSGNSSGNGAITPANAGGLDGMAVDKTPAGSSSADHGDCVAALGSAGQNDSADSEVTGSIHDQTISNGIPADQSNAVQVTAIPEGACRNAGVIVVRYVNNDKRTENVLVVNLTQSVVFGKDGMISIDGWEGYGSTDQAWEAACSQARGDNSSAHDKKSDWNDGYHVTFNGHKVPKVCQ